MLDVAYYLVTRDIAERSGMIASRYRTEDGRFILNNRDLARIRLTSSEYVSGLEGVEEIDKSTADVLIERGGYNLGDTNSSPVSAEADSPVVEQEAVDDAEREEEIEETLNNEEQ